MTTSTMIDGDERGCCARRCAARCTGRRCRWRSASRSCWRSVRRTADTRAAAIIYGVCVVAMLTVSGIYHLPSLFSRDRRVAAPPRPRDDPRGHRRHVHRA